MERGTYSITRGMLSTFQDLDRLSQNLSKAETYGYKKSGGNYEDAEKRTLRANGGKGAEIGTLGNGAKLALEFTDFTPGSMISSSNPYHVAVPVKEGMFAIQIGNGQTRYTRAGDFGPDSNGKLVNGRGHFVLDDRGQTIDVPKTGIVSISEDGNITVDRKFIAKIGVFDGTFTSEKTGYFVSEDAQQMQNPTVKEKSLERSNVNLIELSVKMIQLHRELEIEQRGVHQEEDLNKELMKTLDSTR